MGMDKDIVTNGYIYYVYITDSEFCFAAFQLRYVDSQLSCICAPGQMEDLVCPSLSTHNICTASHKRTLHSRKSHQAPLLTLARRLVHDNANMESNIANFFYSRFPSSAA